MNVVYDPELMGITKHVKDIPIGTTFVGEIDDHFSAFLRVRLAIVDLEEPKRMWISNETMIRNYEEVEATFHVKKRSKEK